MRKADVNEKRRSSKDSENGPRNVAKYRDGWSWGKGQIENELEVKSEVDRAVPVMKR
jgi:hypothetical protein